LKNTRSFFLTIGSGLVSICKEERSQWIRGELRLKTKDNKF